MAAKKKKAGNPWEDHLTRKARSENYPARSVYKLVEIQQKFNLIQKSDHVLDLGCYPGSWLLYAAQQTGKDGKVLGIDLNAVEITLPAHAAAVQKDILAVDDADFLTGYTPFDVILSDMAPATTGRKDVDAMRSFELCDMAFQVAVSHLKPAGHFVCKIFQGSEFDGFQKKIKPYFQTCKIFKPDSCRKQSKEIYIIAKDRKSGGRTNVRT